MLTIKRILALDDAGVGAVAQTLTGSFQRGRDVKVRHGGELNGGVFQRGMLVTDSARGDNHVPGQNVHGDTAAGAHPDEGIRADGRQLLHGDGGRRAADAGGADGHFLPQHGACVNIVLPVHADMDGVVKVAGNGLAASRVAGEKDITSHIALVAVNVILHSDILHIKHLLIGGVSENCQNARSAVLFALCRAIFP